MSRIDLSYVRNYTRFREDVEQVIDKIAFLELTENGSEDALSPLPLNIKKEGRHGERIVEMAKYCFPNAEVYLLPSTNEAADFIIENKIPIVSMSLSGSLMDDEHEKKMAEHAFIITSAGNIGDKGETTDARKEWWCAVGSVDKNLQPKYYSSHGLGFVKTVSFSGIEILDMNSEGTSFSAPILALALLDWYSWHKRTLGVYPTVTQTNMFIKMNSHDIWNEGKDLRTGWGIFRLPKLYEAEEIIIKIGEQMATRFKYKENVSVPETDFVDMIAPAFVKDNRTWISARGFTEADGKKVVWESTKPDQSRYINSIII